MTISNSKYNYSLFLHQQGDRVEIAYPPNSDVFVPADIYKQIQDLQEEALSCSTPKRVLKVLNKIQELQLSKYITFYHENNPSDPFHRGEGTNGPTHLCGLDSQIKYVKEQMLKKTACVIL